ncbi:urease accessory protein UreD [Mangrovicella endophytica]|uniref:urease accessory protein UreD n=1 Tax=Mangrovicella endophytica TaxID=2066697 RepID=UPI001FE044D5|nr:urease accessory protein UreD [Mangrovicella endophytica]
MPLQRARGEARAEVRPVGGRTRLARLHQAGCLKLRFPRLPHGGAEAVLINTSGGLTGGDRLAQRFQVESGAALTVTTQACERVYRASSGRAEVATKARVGPGAGFAWLPQETILFDGGALQRSLEIDCATTSRLLLVESVILGREAMGETVLTGSLRDRWRIRRDGRLVFADDLRLEGAVSALAGHGASLSGNRAFATILVQAPEAEARLDPLRATVGNRGGATMVDGLLIARLVAPDGFSLRKRLIPALTALAVEPLPLVWSL